MAINVTSKDGKKTRVAGVGIPGKTAYEAAQEGGYTGTEAEFNERMAKSSMVASESVLDIDDEGGVSLKTRLAELGGGEGGKLEGYATETYVDEKIENHTHTAEQLAGSLDELSAALLSDTTEVAIWGNTGNRTVDEALAEIGPIAKTALSTANTANAKIISGSYNGVADPVVVVTVSSNRKPVLAIVTAPETKTSNGGYFGIITLNAFSRSSGSSAYFSTYVNSEYNISGSKVSFPSFACNKSDPSVQHRYVIFCA